jgi:hypothetical protein
LALASAVKHTLIPHHNTVMVSRWEAASNFVLPSHRRVTAKQIKNLFRARAKQRAKIGDPLLQLEELSRIRHFDPLRDQGLEDRGIS